MPFALVTGASVGIGRSLALACARDGYDLLLTARSKDQLDRVADEIRSLGRSCIVLAKDLTLPSAAREIAAEIQSQGWPVEVLINNAGFGLLGKFWELDEVAQVNMIQVNVTALTQLTRLLMPAFLARGKGYILNVASTAAFQPGPLMAVYYASKAYVLSLSEALHNEAKGSGVSVTALCPGPTESEFAKRAGVTETALFKSRRPMTAEEVARIGYRAMKRGKPLAIAGSVNALVAFSTRLVPMQVAAAIAGRLAAEK